MTGVYTLIFGAAFAEYYNNSVLNYILAAFTGLMVINFFSTSTSQALNSIVSSNSLLNKIELPVSVFPVSAIIANVFQFLIGALPLLLFLTLVRSQNIFNVFLLPIPFIGLTLVCSGIGFITSALYVFFRDLPYFYELVVFIFWISSPVFYPAEIVPEKVRPFLAINPLSPIIEATRQLTLSHDLPSFMLLGSTLISGLIIFGIGYSFFQYCRPRFMDLL
jgi:ABC-type polysaccharide/polyol phosphate export permease